ncbi:hypothetical protein [Roseibium sp.]|uniref:hypothetical protein n=1 Tax=Roseibium sp. TaxID=1936156 RepID=UPI003A981AE7
MSPEESGLVLLGFSVDHQWISAISALGSFLAASLSFWFFFKGMRRQAIQNRAAFWQQMTGHFADVNDFHGLHGITGPRSSDPDFVQAKMTELFDSLIEERNRDGRLVEEKLSALRASFWKQTNIAHLFFQNEGISTAEREKVRQWYVDGVCKWAITVNEVSRKRKIYQDDKEPFGVFHSLIEEMVLNGGLIGEGFRTSWIREGLDQYYRQQIVMLRKSV